MDDNHTAATRDHDPFRELLLCEGPWTSTGGQRLTHRQTGEAFGRLALSDPQEAPRWNALVEALAGLETARLVIPRAVIDDDSAVLYSAPDDLGESFASRLEDPGTLEQEETVHMAADLAAALRALHARGAVLGRLRLQDVLRAADGGWALVISPASGAHAAEGLELEERSRADVVLLASAAVTVLTGRRPSASRSRPPLRSTHPLLAPQAAEALDLVLERAGRAQGPDRDGGRECAGPGMLTAAQLEALLHQEGPSAAACESAETAWVHSDAADGGPTGAAPAIKSASLSARAWELEADETPADRDGPDAEAEASPLDSRGRHDPLQLLHLRDTAVEEHRTARRDARSARPRTRRVGASTRSSGSMSASAPASLRRPRRVLAAAAAIVLTAGLVAGWQRLSGPDDQSTSAAGDAEQVPGGAGAQGLASADGAVTAEEPTADDAAAADAGESSSSEAPLMPTSEPMPASSPGSSSAAAAVSAQHSPEYASAALIAQRGEALRRGDRNQLESVYLPAAPDLADDLQTLEQAQAEGAFTDLQMVLVDIVPLAVGTTADGTMTGDERRTATVRGTVEATGTDLDPAGDGEATLRQEVSIELVVGQDGAWRLMDVTPL